HSLTETENIFLIGSFGASSVLIYGAIQSPLAQPRNLIGGHVLSALVGVTVYQFIPDIHSLTETENIFLIGSFGASSVLIYGAIQSPLAQP
ncbi:HPP family protein, partial [Chryseobacterium sp. CH1]|uniref:HPP family protein n=1 Tax=Chryseobacterium sp. CH1 TaxID=713551 RepID=UPI001E64E6E5